MIKHGGIILTLAKSAWPEARRWWHGRRVLVRAARVVRTVAGTYEDIEGGLILDEPVYGFRSWHACEVTVYVGPDE